jgi:hypothetical protein
MTPIHKIRISPPRRAPAHSSARSAAEEAATGAAGVARSLSIPRWRAARVAVYCPDCWTPVRRLATFLEPTRQNVSGDGKRHDRPERDGLPAHSARALHHLKGREAGSRPFGLHHTRSASNSRHGPSPGSGNAFTVARFHARLGSSARGCAPTPPASARTGTPARRSRAASPPATPRASA